MWEPRTALRWLLANRAGSNLVIYWMLLAAYTSYRYYNMNAGVDRDEAPDEAPDDPLSRIPVRLGERTGFVPIDEISFIEAERNQLVIHTANAQHSIRSALHDLETPTAAASVSAHPSLAADQPRSRGDNRAMGTR